MGRPEWIPTPERIEKAEGYAALGLTKEQIARCLGISYETLNEKTKYYPEFSDAIKDGQAKGIARAANLLIKFAEGGSVPSVIFYLKAVGKWSDQNLEEVQTAIKSELDEVRKMVQECLQEKN